MLSTSGHAGEVIFTGVGLASLTGEGLMSAANGLDVSRTKGDSGTSTTESTTSTGVCRAKQGSSHRRLRRLQWRDTTRWPFRHWATGALRRPGCGAQKHRAPTARVTSCKTAERLACLLASVVFLILEAAVAFLADATTARQPSRSSGRDVPAYWVGRGGVPSGLGFAGALPNTTFS